MSGPTLFTRIIEGDVPASFVGKGDDWVAFLDINPRREGHTLVVPHTPAQHLSELSADAHASLWEGVRRVQSVLGAHFDTKDFTVVVHDGVAAGQEVPHVHVHVVPRLPGDGGQTLLAMFPIAPLPGEVDPDFEALAALAHELRRGA